MKNALYENIISNIAKIVKKTINEASIFDMETAYGKANTKSKASLKREKNIVYRLKAIGINAQYIAPSSRETSVNSKNDENKLIKGEVYSEFQTIKVNNPINNELYAGEYYIYVKGAQKNYNNCVIDEKLDKFGHTLWDDDSIRYIAFILTNDANYYNYYIVEKKQLKKEFDRLVEKFIHNNAKSRMLDKGSGNTVMYTKPNGYTCTFCSAFLKSICVMKFQELKPFNEY